MIRIVRSIAFAITLGSLTTANAQELPKTIIKDVHSGKQVPFDKIFKKGEVTLVSFWATWCIPGKRQAKTIVKNLPEWRKQVKFNYIAIAVDQQQNEELVRPFVQKQGWNFPVYLDANSELKRAMDFNALPYIMIVDKNGSITFTHTGFDNGDLILAKLKEK